MSVWCSDDKSILFGTGSQEIAVYEQVISSLEAMLVFYKQYLEEQKEEMVYLFESLTGVKGKTAEEITEIDGWTDVFDEINLVILDVEREITKYKIKLIWAKLNLIDSERSSFHTAHYREFELIKCSSIQHTVYPAIQQKLD